MGFFKRNKEPARPWCSAVVAAAGSSARMEGTDKILLPLAGEPVLIHTLRAFQQSPRIMEIVVVTREDQVVEVSGLCQKFGFDKVTTVIVGGPTRTRSVLRGISAVSKKAKLIAIQDGARPLVTQAVIAAAVDQAALSGAAAPAVPVKDTVKELSDGRVSATLDRGRLRAVQTPQVFDADLIRAALHQAVTEEWDITDDCAAVERIGATVVLTPGDERNLKITTPLDAAVAEAILSREE